MGRSLGNLISGCPLRGPCGSALPVLLSIPPAVVGMGVGCAIAASRVRHWLEGVVTFGTGILTVVGMVVLVGWLTSRDRPGALLAVAWLGLAAVLGLRASWGRRRRDPGG